jgi:acyl carrier protein
MEDEILNYIKNEFGNNNTNKIRTSHYSYCLFPEENCTCNELNDIDNNTSLISGGYIDSFSMVAVLVYMENRFDVKIPDRETIPENFDTVNKMVELIKRFKK